jgi:hypothetical protein
MNLGPRRIEEFKPSIDAVENFAKFLIAADLGECIIPVTIGK